MTKKVRHVLGAVGVAPALGLMMPTVTATAANVHAVPKAAKTVSIGHYQQGVSSDGTCIASRPHTTAHSGVTIKTWSKPIGTGTCIGTVSVTANEPGEFVIAVGGSVVNNNGRFCQHYETGTHVVFHCNHIFDRAGLRVFGYASGFSPYFDTPWKWDVTLGI